MDEVDFCFFRAWRQSKRLSHPVLKGPLDLAGAIDVIVRVPVNRFHFGEVFFIGEPRVYQRGPERACPFVTRIVVDGGQRLEWQHLAVVKLVEQYIRQFIHHPDMGIGARSKFCGD